MTDVEPDLTHAMWGEHPIPNKFTILRPHQVVAIRHVLDAYRRGAKVVFLDAPTGSGKTIIAECVRRLVATEDYSTYTCTTKSLQDQILADFPYARVVKGRANYTTQDNPNMSCDECLGHGPHDCAWCTNTCPYLDARNKALIAPLGVVNTAYLLTVMNSGAERPMFSDRHLTIIDEGDLLEQNLMSYIEVTFSRWALDRYRLGRPDRITVRESWHDWAKRAHGTMAAAAARLPERATTAEQVKEATRVLRALDKLAMLGAQLETDDKWIYDPTGNGVTFRPVTVSQYGSSRIWRHSEKWLVMSASLISPEQMVADLGCDLPWEQVTVPSTFDPANRPVHVVNCGSMAYKHKDRTTPNILRAVANICVANPDERVLVHTVSYDLTKQVANHLRDVIPFRPVVHYTSAAGRQQALEEYVERDGAVLVAPSMDRGIDLPDELCRVQIITKVPYPHLGDKQVQARLYGTAGGQRWYEVQTVRSMVQMTGRGVRSATDHATTYILDGAFGRLWKSSKDLFPHWWTQAVDWTGAERLRLGL